MRKTLTIGILGTIGVMAAVAWLYSAYNVRTTVSDGMSTSTPISVQESAPRPVPDGSREYRSATYGFSLIYPQDLAVSEHAEAGNAVTITFQNVEKAQGFQIFILPYMEEKISEVRFRKDLPSGVREDLRDAVVGGAKGAAFYSIDGALGETREIWFIHKDYLYEVTTLKTLDQWMQGIMQTWRFL